MTTDDLIKSGWKEDSVLKIDQFDRVFYKKFGEQQIALRMWDFTKYNHGIKWDIAGNLDNIHIQISIELERLNEECENMLRMFKVAN